MLCAAATVGGNELQEFAGNELHGINGFAAGALLVMLVCSMIPEASERQRTRPVWPPSGFRGQRG